MLILEHTIKTKATSKKIWSIWSDVSHWNTWDHGIEFSQINGPFEVGTRGILKPKGGPLVHTHLTQVEPLKGFVDESTLPLTKIIVSHYLKDCGTHREVTHKIEMKGLLAFFFAFVIGRQMKKNLPTEMMAMVRKAENEA